MNKSIEKLIERYEEQIEDLEDKIYGLEERLERAECWANERRWDRPRVVPLSEIEHLSKLPVPRLQIELTILSESKHSWFYSMVYQATCDDITETLTFIPMGQTTSTGGHRYDKYDSLEEMMAALPFRDGVNIRRDAAHLNLPAYAITEGFIWELPPIESSADK